MSALPIVLKCILFIALMSHSDSAPKMDEDSQLDSAAESASDKNIKIFHFTSNYFPEILKSPSKDMSLSSTMVDKLIPDHNKVIFLIQLREPLTNIEVIRNLCRAVADELNLELDSIKVSKYDPLRGLVKMYFLYTVKRDNNTDVLELRPATEVLKRLNQKRFQKAGTSIRILDVKNGIESPYDFNNGRKISIQSIFSDKNWEAWQLAVVIAACLFAIFCVLVVILFISSHHFAKDKVGPIDEPRHVVVQPILRPAVAGIGVIQPENRDRIIAETDSEHTPSPSRSPLRLKGKGLLERRGSNASLTLDLNRSQENIHCGTPPKNGYSAEEYLQSAGKKMTRRQLRSSLKDVKTLHSEFWEIPMNHPEKVEVAGSGTKNRYKTILPNESTRVNLYEKNGDPLSSYINANYVRGYGGETRAYIATQGPMSHTVNDFWTMVWKEKSSLIVMITKLKEKMKVKCEPYIPDYQDCYNDIEVTVTRVIPRDGFTIRELFLRRGSETHTVRHFWYTAWPDHKTPETAKQLLAMALEVESLRRDASGATKGPMVVHCSAGIGRTGCFIAVSIGIQQLLEENMIDVLGIVCSLRLDRGGMVQTAEQYEFVHQALSIFESSLPGTSVD
ncbi:LOW QUALITY PROTEIN: tyrosine-protein phosphatase non-receptor type 5-like [Uloborus diversus]|uniref:LOW QUALITY PROTEIN: tyrosine-protein phosphatase non-receptor type 5-like n=1 Tax=Uloborus diversus TaxID=327109 RepID=UPI0024098284|nr:LOW QUALITY PROTEIN: tyrosine-protein phosphatase non-receptor type 5-like [Uloborus diversus]